MQHCRTTELFIRKGIKTHTVKKGWEETGNSAYSVFEKYRQRKERSEFRNREYELKWEKMRIEWSIK